MSLLSKKRLVLPQKIQWRNNAIKKYFLQDTLQTRAKLKGARAMGLWHKTVRYKGATSTTVLEAPDVRDLPWQSECWSQKSSLCSICWGYTTHWDLGTHCSHTGHTLRCRWHRQHRKLHTNGVSVSVYWGACQHTVDAGLILCTQHKKLEWRFLHIEISGQLLVTQWVYRGIHLQKE